MFTCVILFAGGTVRVCRHYNKLRKHIVGRVWGMNATSLPAPYRDLLFVEKIILCLDLPLFLPTSARITFIMEKPHWDVLAGPWCGQILVFICPDCVSLFQSNCWIEMTKMRNKLWPKPISRGSWNHTTSKVFVALWDGWESEWVTFMGCCTEVEDVLEGLFCIYYFHRIQIYQCGQKEVRGHLPLITGK